MYCWDNLRLSALSALLRPTDQRHAEVVCNLGTSLVTLDPVLLTRKLVNLHRIVVDGRIRDLDYPVARQPSTQVGQRVSGYDFLLLWAQAGDRQAGDVVDVSRSRGVSDPEL